MIESGSLTPGIDPADFRLPKGTAMRMERPVDALCVHFPSYRAHDSDAQMWRGQVNWRLPGGPQIWLVIAEPISVTLRNRRYPRLPTAVLYGPTTAAAPLISNGGPSIAVEVSAPGWARWFDAPAETVRDRIAPLAELWPAERVRELVEAVADLGDGTGMKAALDDVFLRHLPSPDRREPMAEAVRARLAEGGDTGSAALAERVGLSEQQLRRLTLHGFGFAPKLLIRRQRFLRAMTALLLTDDPEPSVVPDGYASLAHFHRDASEFLTLTPRRFLAESTAYLRSSLRARKAVIGAPAPLLDRRD